jgi:hypothetical protein
VDYAKLIKIFGRARPGADRYSPLHRVRATRDLKASPVASTSLVELQNLSMRMGMRPFTRLTNAHSKMINNHSHMIALYFMHYNYCKTHSTLRDTPHHLQASRRRAAARDHLSRTIRSPIAEVVIVRQGQKTLVHHLSWQAPHQTIAIVFPRPISFQGD